MLLQADPDGLNAHDPGAKLDAHKLPLGKVLRQFPNALRAVATVGKYGAEKYTWDGWQKVINGRERYADAHLRHAIPDDGLYDDESGILHAAHAAWNALAELEKLLEQGYVLETGSGAPSYISQSTPKQQESMLEKDTDPSISQPVIPKDLPIVGEQLLIHSQEKLDGQISNEKALSPI